MKLIVAQYGPWYLARLSANVWHPMYFYDVEHSGYIESLLIEEHVVDSEHFFESKADALRMMIRSMDREIEAGGGYERARHRAAASLVSVLHGDDESVELNEFAGTDSEKQLIQNWISSDLYAEQSRRAFAAKRAAFDEACAEQKRREKVFERLLHIFGEAMLDEINAAIAEAWRADQPKVKHNKHGRTRGEILPMPQLFMRNGRAAFHNHGRAAPTVITTPLSKRDSMKAFECHWQHPTWMERVVPAMARIIDRLEQEAEGIGPRWGIRDTDV